jgi:hypothetical protein
MFVACPTSAAWAFAQEPWRGALDPRLAFRRHTGRDNSGDFENALHGHGGKGGESEGGEGTWATCPTVSKQQVKSIIDCILYA